MYRCVVCEEQKVSVVDLHFHLTRCHTPEELSFTIINLQGLPLFQVPQEPKNKNVIKLKGVNNNEALYTPVHLSAKYRTPSKFHYVDCEEENCNFGHDQEECSKNCSLFVPWECELNQKLQVDHDDFLISVVGLCADLQKLKHKNRKRKKRAEETVTFNGNEETIEIKKEIEEDWNLLPSDGTLVSTSTSQEEVLNLCVQKDNDDDNPDSLVFVGMDNEKNCIMYDPTRGNFTWNSIVPVNCELEETLFNTENNVDDKNSLISMILSDSMPNNFMENGDGPCEENKY